MAGVPPVDGVLATKGRGWGGGGGKREGGARHFQYLLV